MSQKSVLEEQCVWSGPLQRRQHPRKMPPKSETVLRGENGRNKASLAMIVHLPIVAQARGWRPCLTGVVVILGSSNLTSRGPFLTALFHL